MSTGRVLLSGFEPFGGAAHNPSQAVVQALDGLGLPGGEVIEGVVLPVAFEAAPARLAQAIEHARPRLVLALGLAADRQQISLERVALNLCDASIADNAGARPVDCPVLEGGPPALFATLPLRAMLAALHEAGLPAQLSLSAGSFVCNALLYRLLYALAETRVPAGFMHLPPTEHLGFERQVRAVHLALAVAAGRPRQRSSLST